VARLARTHGEDHAREAGTIVPFRAAFPELPRLMERLDELFAERWTPFWPMLRMPEELHVKTPPVDVFEEGAEIVAKAELPGMKREEIEVRLTGTELTISGRKEKTEKVERKDYHRFERTTGAFTRTVTLPAEVELEKATARYENGVLEVRAPKLTPAKETERKIEVA
jgi:HSP20 family protein